MLGRSASLRLAPNPNEGSGKPYLPGESYAFILDTALASASASNPSTFQGYIIAVCNYEYAHGLAYLVYGTPGTPVSTSTVYLPLVLNRNNPIAADSLGN